MGAELVKCLIRKEDQPYFGENGVKAKEYRKTSGQERLILREMLSRILGPKWMIVCDDGMSMIEAYVKDAIDPSKEHVEVPGRHVLLKVKWPHKRGEKYRVAIWKGPDVLESREFPASSKIEELAKYFRSSLPNILMIVWS